MQRSYDRLMKVSLEETLDAINQNGHSKERVLFNGQMIRFNSLRLKTFATKGIICSCCGMKARHFAIERTPGQESYHLNLWGKKRNGTEVLFTHDHTIARCLGGPDHISNTTTMCSLCNHKKSQEEKLLIEEKRKAA